MTCVALVAALMASSAVGAAPTLLAESFFGKLPKAGKQPAKIEADYLSYNADTSVVTAEGGVVLSYQGYVAHGDSLAYNTRTREMRFVGAVTIRDPSGLQYTADSLEVTGEMKAAVLRSLTIVTPLGSTITATDAQFGRELETILVDATYSPCGDCIDSKGRRIGWSVRAAKLTLNSQTNTVYIEQPQLELLGVPVAWLPFLSFPNPTKERGSGFRFPSVGYSEETGLMVTVPYFLAAGKKTDILFTPTLVARQGVLMGAELTQRFKKGAVSVKVSGIYQLQPDAFEDTVGDRPWRGALQSAGEFVPLRHWTTGWSYTAFTDAAYLPDYRLATASSKVNEVYATHFDPDSFYADFRLQHFNLLGDVTEEKQGEQALALPNAQASKVIDFGGGYGQARLEGWLLGVDRDLDDVDKAGDVKYVFGYAGRKVHGTVQASWQNQWIGPGGVLATPYVGLRGDAASYNGGSDLMPDAATLYSLTPIAAVDVRWPLAIRGGGAVQIVEPIGQLVYRGSDESLVGITNDNAQSFVFDDTNLFSYNRFSGTDRQETGLRVNIGGHYQFNYGDSWFELLAGQSFQLAGENGLGVSDGAQVGTSSGLGGDASYVVLGAKGSLFGLVEGAAKLQIDPDDMQVTRAGFGIDLSPGEGYSLALDYTYLAANEELGVAAPQHEVGALASVPLFDYWTVTAGVSWDIESREYLNARGGIEYDDGYLQFGADITRSNKSGDNPDETRFMTNFKLKAPEGTLVSF